MVRGWHVEGLAVRPDHRMIAHTGFLITALGMILQALVSILINSGVSPSVAILLVAGASAVIGLVLFLMGQNRLDPAELSPYRTLNSLSRDSRMVKETLS